MAALSGGVVAGSGSCGSAGASGLALQLRLAAAQVHVPSAQDVDGVDVHPLAKEHLAAVQRGRAHVLAEDGRRSGHCVGAKGCLRRMRSQNVFQRHGGRLWRTQPQRRRDRQDRVLAVARCSLHTGELPHLAWLKCGRYDRSHLPPVVWLCECVASAATARAPPADGTGAPPADAATQLRVRDQAHAVRGQQAPHVGRPLGADAAYHDLDAL
mmetsp:Transcript_37796/g.111864  ORF Transcript_37796/g.111864 Transcript_37796/m.111864 type:complete len:212 (-) Transcript_37796:1829-2464(-)